jgi:hypothetical protein
LKITDEWTVKVSEVLNLLQKRIEEEKESRQLEVKDMNGIVDNLVKQFQVFSDFLLTFKSLIDFSAGSEEISRGILGDTQRSRV